MKHHHPAGFPGIHSLPQRAIVDGPAGSLTKRRAGFTLVELLVAILIIAGLAALAFPMANRMLAKAKIASVSNCFRSTGLAIQQYAADNNQKFPGPLIWTQPVALKGTLFNYLAPYMGTEKLPTAAQDIFATGAYKSYVPEYLRKQAAGNLSYGYYAVNTVGYLPRSDGVLQCIWGYGMFSDASGNPEKPKTLSEVMAISRIKAARGYFNPENQLALLKTLSTAELTNSLQSDHLKGNIVYLYLDCHTEVKPFVAGQPRAAGDY